MLPRHRNANAKTSWRTALRDVALLQLQLSGKRKKRPRLGARRLPFPGREYHRRLGRDRARETAKARQRRADDLIATGKPANLPIRRSIASGSGARQGLRLYRRFRLGRCSRTRNRVPLSSGSISWSTGPNGSAGCAG